MFFAWEETPRLNVHKKPPSMVVTRQPKRLTRAPDRCPEKKMSAMAREPTQAAKTKNSAVSSDKTLDYKQPLSCLRDRCARNKRKSRCEKQTNENNNKQERSVEFSRCRRLKRQLAC